MMAVVLAAGIGSRLHPYTQGIPKPLVPLSIEGGQIKVVAERLLEQLKRAGVADVVMVVNHKKDAIMDYFGNGKRYGLSIFYCFQEELNGDAGGIYLSGNLLKETFIAIDADNYYEDDDVFKKMAEAHKESKATATVATTKVDDTRKFAILKVENGRVLDTVEKPLENPKWGNDAKLGIFVFEPEIFELGQEAALNESGIFSTTRLLKTLADEGREVRAVPIKGVFTDIGTWDSYQKFHEWVAKHGGKV